MIKFIWIAVALLIVYCLQDSSVNARISPSGAYQHLNNIIAPAARRSHDNNEGNTLSESTSAAMNSDTRSSSALSPFWQDLSLIYKIYQQCANENLSICLKVKLLTVLERTLRHAKDLKIMEGVQFVGSSDIQSNGEKRNGRSGEVVITEKDIESVLPRSADAKEQVLNNMIFKKIAGFLKDHTLQVKFPTEQLVEEGRRKKRKGNGAFIMIPLLLGGTMVPIAYGALALLAGKALIVSKLALVLASILGIKKLLSGSGGKDSHEVVVSSGSHSGWGRDMDLAYNGWRRASVKEQTKTN